MLVMVDSEHLCFFLSGGILDVRYRNKIWNNTVDGRNPAPPRMMIIPLFIGF